MAIRYLSGINVDSNTLFVDDANNRVGIGTASPNSALEISQLTPIVRINSSDNTQFHGIEFRNGGNLDAFIKQLPETGEFRISNGRGASWGGHITLYTDTVERLRITAAGNVGIGTTSPAYKLDVYGDIRSGGADPLMILQPDSGTYAFFQKLSSSNGNYLRLYDGTNYSTFWKDGNVGIGTTSPNYKLDVNGSINIYTGNSLRWGSGDVEILNSGYSMLFSTYTGSALTEKMRITSAGNVGIGTTSPVVKLQVDGTITSTGVLTAYTSVPSINIGHNGDSAFIAATSGGGADTPISFSVGNNNEKMRITAAGNVGIGTTSPASKLHISNATGNVTSEIQSVASGANAILKLTSPSNNWQIINDGTSANLDFQRGGSSQVYFKSDGNVGIGTTSPLTALHVIGLTTIEESGNIAFYGGNFVRVFNDQNFNIRNVSGTTVANISVNGASYFNGGNVGIGTTSPSYKLDVNGATQIQNELILSTNDAAFRLYRTTGVNYFDWSSGQDLRFSTVTSIGGAGRSTAVTFLSTGNVGIGTTSPSQKLEVSGNAKVTGVVYTDVVATNSGTAIDFRDQAAASIMYLDAPNKRVGIGTTSPSVALHTNGFIRSANSGNTVYTEVQNDGLYATGTDLYLLAPSTKFISFYAGGAERMRISSAGALKLNAYGSGSNTGTATQRLAVDASGNVIEIPIGSGPVDGNGTANYVTKWSDADTITNSVIYENGGNIGIGVTNADYPLTVGSINVGGAGANLGLVLNSVISTAIPSSSVKSIIGATNSGFGYAAGSLLIQPRTGVNAVTAFATEGTEKMRITHDGNVGIGTTSPSSILDASLSGGATSGFRFKGWSDASTPYLLSLGTQTYPDVFQVKSVNGLVTMGVVGATGAAPDLVLQTNTTERMRITSAGNVGIGMTSPSYKLDVFGGFNAVTSGVNITYDNGILYHGNYYQITSGNNYLLYARGGGALLLGSDDVERIRITSGGNVGIGTTSPGYKLDVNGAINSTTATTSGTGTLNLGTTVEPRIAGQITGTQSPSYSSTGKLGFSVTTWGVGSDYGLTEVMAIDMRGADSKAPTIWMNPFGGNVGIGTTTPVSIGTGITTLDIQGSNAGGVAFGPSGFKNYIYGASTMYVEAHTTAVFTTSGSEKMRITSAGNVGIGTTSPGAKLDIAQTGGTQLRIVSGDAYGSADVQIELVSANDYRGRGIFYKNSTDSNQWFSGVPYTGGSYSIGYHTSQPEYLANSKFFINTSGNVGIGTTSPSTKLHVLNAGSVAMIGDGNDNYFGNYSSGDYWDIGNLGATGNVYLESRGASTNINGHYRLKGAGSHIWSYNGGSNEVMRTTSAGNVGIGTTAPGGKLQIVDGSSGTTNDSSTTLYVENSGTSNSFYVLQTATVGGGKSFSITNAGNVGIGNTLPSQKLHVTGNIRVTGAYYDSNNSAGSSGQVLSSTGSGTDWVSLSEITGVDGTGTANYVAKWSDTDTITNSSITDNGSTVTATVDRLNMNKQAGIYVFSKTVGTSTTSDFFSISNLHGAQAFRVTFVCSSSNYSVAKTYEVVHGYGGSPVYNKIVDTGAYSGNDFDVVFADSSSTGTKATVTNNSATSSGNIVATVFLGGGAETITVTAL